MAHPNYCTYYVTSHATDESQSISNAANAKIKLLIMLVSPKLMTVSIFVSCLPWATAYTMLTLCLL